MSASLNPRLLLAVFDVVFVGAVSADGAGSTAESTRDGAAGSFIDGAARSKAFEASPVCMLCDVPLCVSISIFTSVFAVAVSARSPGAALDAAK